MNKKNVVFILAIVFIFVLLVSNLKYTGFAIYRVPFNIEIDILNKDKEVKTGDNLNINLIFFNINKPRSVDFNYSIKSLTSQNIVTREETLFVEKELVVTRDIQIPKSAPSGYYLLEVKWDQENSKTSSLFKIKSESRVLKFFIINVLVSILLILITLLIIIFIITHHTTLDEINKLNKAAISLFFWKISWRLKQHNYYIKYIISIIIICLLIIILILINY